MKYKKCSFFGLVWACSTAAVVFGGRAAEKHRITGLPPINDVELVHAEHLCDEEIEAWLKRGQLLQGMRLHAAVRVRYARFRRRHAVRRVPQPRSTDGVDGLAVFG